jgi:hypothetical protein
MQRGDACVHAHTRSHKWTKLTSPFEVKLAIWGTIILSTCGVCSTWLASCLWRSYLLGSYAGYYVTCSFHPHPNLAQKSISASDPLIETVTQRLTATICLHLYTAFSTPWVGHLYKLHKFLHFTWWKRDPCIFTHGRIRHPLNQPHRPRMAWSLEWLGLDWHLAHSSALTTMAVVYCRQTQRQTQHSSQRPTKG